MKRQSGSAASVALRWKWLNRGKCAHGKQVSGLATPASDLRDKVFIPEQLATGKMAQIEQLLEDKSRTWTMTQSTATIYSSNSSELPFASARYTPRWPALD